MSLLYLVISNSVRERQQMPMLSQYLMHNLW